MENKNKLSPWWVTGITDSEGNFSINYNSKSKKISASFKVTQKDHSVIILTDLKDFFGCGNINIDNSKFNTFKFIVSKISDLKNLIVPHFEEYPLVGSKHLDFLDFKKTLLLFSEQNSENLEEILLIKNNMNKKRSYEERWNYLNGLTLELKPEWVQAFIDGEGTFQCRIADTVNRGKSYISINPTLEVAQSSHDIEVLNIIKNFFDVGYLKPKYNIKSLDESKKSRSVSRLIINQSGIVIDFFNKYPLFTRKHLDFLDWKKIIELKSKDIHKTPEGKQSMIDLKLTMNRGRLLNSNLLDSSGRLKIVRWSNLPVDKKGYHTKTLLTRKNNLRLQLLYILILFLLTIGNFIMYTYIFDLWIYCIKQILLILFFFSLTMFYLDDFKFSDDKWIRYSQIIIFTLFVLLAIFYVGYFYSYGYTLLEDITLKINSDDVENIKKKADITLQGKVVLDKEAGVEVAKGISSLGSNIGLAGCVGALAAGATKAVAKSSLPPVQKVGLIFASGVAGAAIQVGASAINAQRSAVESNDKLEFISKNDKSLSLPKDVNKFLDYSVGDNSPLDILLQCVLILNSISIWLILFLSIQFMFRFVIKDKPELKFIDRISLNNSNKIRGYIYKLIKINKSMNRTYITIGIFLLLICLSGSMYFSLELYNNLSSYVDVYLKYHK